MKNAQELIDAIKDVPEDLFDQNLYEDVVRVNKLVPTKIEY